MKKHNPKLFAQALLALCRGKKKGEVEKFVKGLVMHKGIAGQLKFLERVARALSEQIAQEKGVRNVRVMLPVYDEKKVRALSADLAKRTKADVEITVEQDPSLIAGAVVTVGDRRYDGSVKARIRQLRKALA